MTTATHPVALEEIMALLDGELSADRTQAVSTHAESCADCHTVLTSLRNSSRSLASWAVASIPRQVENRILTASAENPNKPRGLVRPGSFLQFKRNRWFLGLALSSCALLFLVVTSREASKVKPSSPRFDSWIVRLPARSIPATKAEPRPVDHAQVAEAREAEPANLDGTLGKLTANYKHLSTVNGRIAGDLAKLYQGPMVARTVSLSMIVKDFDASRSSLDSVLARHNGYSANLTVSTPQGAAKSLQASLRIPAPELTAALHELKGVGRVENESQSGEEVTQQHADLVARLKNSRETEQRLQAILTQHTGKIGDVLEVEQEIARVRGEIEQMEAEQKNLEHRVDFATIDLKLSEEYKAQLSSPAPAISTQIHNALVNGYRNVADTLLALVLFFAEYGPVLLLWCAFLLAPAYLVWRRWRTATASA